MIFPDVRFDFTGRVAIVTGAGQGIGKAVALAFARAGAKVAIAEVDAEAGAEAEAQIKAALALALASASTPASASVSGSAEAFASASAQSSAQAPAFASTPGQVSAPEQALGQTRAPGQVQGPVQIQTPARLRTPGQTQAPDQAQPLAEAGGSAQPLFSPAPDARPAAVTPAGDVVFIPTDVADEESVDRMVRQVGEKWGRVDILVNNAGISSPTTGPAGKTLTGRPVSAFDRVLAVNLRGPYLCARAVVPFMRRQGGGVIINIASTRALMSEPHTEPYSASKGGLLALTHSLAISLGPDKIRVNAISPGWIEVSDWKKRAQRQAPALRPVDHAQHPVGRVGRPGDIAAACLFLASEAAGFITGQNLVIDGGMTVKMIYVE